MNPRTITVTLLSAPRILLDEQPVTIPYRKAEALFYYLVLQKEATRAELCTLLWDSGSDSQSLKNLRNALYNLKRCFGFDAVVAPSRSVLCLNPEVWVDSDVHRFLDDERPELYGGGFLCGFGVQGADRFEEWLGNTRSSLRDTYLRRLLHRLRGEIAAGHHEQAEVFALDYLKEEPYDERVTSLLMTQYREQHLYHRAVEIYQRLCACLEEDLGILPLKETTELYYQIMNEWNEASHNRQSHPEYLTPGQLSVYQKMQDAFRERDQPFSRSAGVILSGESGVGKTYLLDFFLRNAVRDDCLLLASACYQSEMSAAYASWQAVMLRATEYLAENKIDVPPGHLGVVSRFFNTLTDGLNMIAPPEDGPDSMGPFNFRGVSEGILMILSKLSKRVRLLLVFEDIHWMDRFSLSMLVQVLKKLNRENILVLCACRTPLGEPCASTIAEITADQLANLLTVQPFTLQETQQLAERLAKTRLAPDMLERLFHETHGNALLLVQYLNTWQENSGGSGLPASRQDILSYRLSGLSPNARQVVDIIALFPDHAPYELLEAMVSKSALELLYICDELKRRMIVSERESGGKLYLAFSHQQLQELVCRQMAPLNRRILHQRIGRLLEQLPVDRYPNIVGKMIYHFRMGGDSQNAFKYKAICLDAYVSLHCEVMYLEAQSNFFYQSSPVISTDIIADYTTESDLYRYFSAMLRELEDFRRANTDPEWLDEQESVLLYAKARVFIYLGRYEDGLEAVHALLEHPRICKNPLITVRAHRQMIFYSIQTYRLEVMRRHLELAFPLTQQIHNPVEMAIHYRLQGVYHLMTGEYMLGERFFRQSLDLLGQLDRDNERYIANIAWAYNYLGEIKRRQLDFEGAAAEYEEAISLSHNDEYTGTAMFCTNYGQAAFAGGDHGKAQAMFRRAVALYERGWSLNGRAVALAYLALYAARRGEEESALQLLRDALCFMEIYGSPLEQGIVYSVMAQLKLQCGAGPLAEFLTEPLREYCERGIRLLQKTPGAYEINMLYQCLAEC